MGKWTRRAFITTGVLGTGAVIFGVAIRPGNRASKVKDLVGTEADVVFNIWVKLSPDNTVTAIVPHAEMGQGTHTALAMMLADEMDADWDKVRIQEAPAHKEYANYALAKGFIAGEASIPSFLIGTVDGTFLTITKAMGLQITGGSSSVRFTGRYAMRVAGAAAKDMLLRAAADSWEVDVASLTTKDSHILHPESGKQAPYAEFAQEAAQLSTPSNPKLKSDKEFTIMGTSPQRLDIPAKVDGTAKFGIDAIVPGMKYATIKASPVFGNGVASVDASAVAGMQGVHKVVTLEDAVAVVADGYWTAKTALGQLNIQFEQSENDQVDQEDIFSKFGEALDSGNSETDIKIGDPANVLATAQTTIEAEYKVPFLAHATMEPMNCTAWIHDDICELWIGSQNPLGFAHAVADELGMKKSQVVVHNQYLGGGFGRRAESDIALQAVKIAKEAGVPVKLIWSREEDTQHGFYRDANISRFKAGLDETGKPIAWENQFLFKHEPKEASHIPYQIDNQYIHFAQSKIHVPWGNWRSVDHSHHGFFTESFIDELAQASGKDPFEFRQGLLSHRPRLQKVLETAAEKAEWGKELPKNWGRGIALQQSFGSIVAEVVEVEFLNGKIRPHRVVCAIDAGFAVHPNGLIAQMESGIIYGLTAAMYGEISIEKGAVKQSNFHDYKMVRINEAPIIETHIINSGEALGGAGEPGTPAIAPAFTNAIFDAIGVRIRELPVSKVDFSKEKLVTDPYS